MLISGFISIFQITFLPGFIFIEISKIKTGSPIQRWLYIFSFSLFINYSLVTVLTLLSIYTFYVMWGLLIVEILLLVFFCKAQLSRLFSKVSLRHLYIKYSEFLSNKSPADRVIITLAGLVILFYCSAFLANIGTIFYFIDTVNNYEWNSWAIDFANNILPNYSSHFPQLLPANWSISYVMIDKTDVHFFPKTIMPLFFISNLLIFLDLAVQKKDRVFLAGLIIYGLFAPIIYSLVFIVDGNADLPVSFFAFLTFYSLMGSLSPDPFPPVPILSGKEKGLNLKAYTLIFLFAAMAAATKLAGFYTFAVTGLFLSLSLLINRKNISLTEIFKLAVFAICVISISLFWYFRTPEVMVSGLHQPGYLPEGYTTTAFRALKLMYYNWGLPVFAFFVITITASLFQKKVRYISLIMVIIPVAIWMFKYSVDFRNLSFVVPFLCFSSAVGLFKIISLSRTSKLAANENGKNLKVKAEEPSGLAVKETLAKKHKLILLLTSALSAIVLLLFISDKFYLFLLSIYEFIFKYYFLRNRITYFIEYDFLLHVDFYQRVLVALSIILIILPILILIKTRLKTLLLFILISLTFLNFTVITEKNILEHQAASFNKVDARNYYEWLKMFINNAELGNRVSTNFKAILKDKIPRELNFYYMEDVSKTSLEKIKEKNYQVFLKVDILSSDTADFIKLKISSNEYKLLFNDRDFTFVLFIVNPE
jgi:hypothetical protein